MSDTDCQTQRQLILDLIGTLFHPDYTRVAVIGYGNGGAGVMLSLDDSFTKGREEFLNELANIDLCDSSTVDTSNACGLALETGIGELINHGNALAVPVMIHIQNGGCGDDPCDNSIVISLQVTDINTYVLNFGPNAIDNQTICAVSNGGQEYYSNEFNGDMLDLWLEHFAENFCRERMLLSNLSFIIYYLFVFWSL